MKRILYAAVLAAAVAVPLSASADVIVSTDEAKVSVKMDCRGAGYALVMIKNRASGEYVYANQTAVNNDVFAIDAFLDKGISGGYYDITVTTDNALMYNESFFYADADYSTQIINSINALIGSTDNNSKQELLSIIETNSEVIAFDADKLATAMQEEEFYTGLLSGKYSSLDDFNAKLNAVINAVCERLRKETAMAEFNGASADVIGSVLQKNADVYGIELGDAYLKFSAYVNETLSKRNATDISDIAQFFEEAMALPYLNEAPRADLIDVIYQYDSYLGVYDRLMSLTNEQLASALKQIEKKVYYTADEILRDIEAIRSINDDTQDAQSVISGGNKRIVSVSNELLNRVDKPRIIQDVSSDGVPFYDMNSAAWAKESVKSLYEKGVIGGRNETEFAPDEPITRAEFVKMLVAAFDMNAAQTEPFSDAEAGKWYYDYLLTARANGIIAGDENNIFRPDDNISRQDAAVMLYRCLNNSAMSAEYVFTDDEDISDYAHEAVYAMKKAGIISGQEGGYFRPHDTATRAQCAVMVYSATENANDTRED